MTLVGGVFLAACNPVSRGKASRCTTNSHIPQFFGVAVSSALGWAFYILRVCVLLHFFFRFSGIEVISIYEEEHILSVRTYLNEEEVGLVCLGFCLL